MAMELTSLSHRSSFLFFLLGGSHIAKGGLELLIFFFFTITSQVLQLQGCATTPDLTSQSLDLVCSLLGSKYCKKYYIINKYCMKRNSGI